MSPTATRTAGAAQEQPADHAAPIPLVLRRELRNMRGERPTGFTSIERIIVDPAHSDR